VSWLGRNWRRILTPVCTLAPLAVAPTLGLEAAGVVAALCGVLLGKDAHDQAAAKKALADELASVRAALPHA
jgi:hypothetical protein